MQDLNDKAINGSLTNIEWNGRSGEEQRVVEAWATLSGTAGDEQLEQAIAAYAAASQFYTCTGPADAYVATVLSGIQAPSDYFQGMVVRMRPSNTNTGASTVNVATLGVKDIVKEDASVVLPGDLSINRDAYMRYDAGIGKFRLSVATSGQIVSLISDSLNSGYLKRQSGSVIRLHPGLREILAINIDGEVVTRSTFIDFDITTDVEAGGEVASTAYYLYVENVAGVITPHLSVTVPDLPGAAGKTGYHTSNTDWRCIGGAWNDVGSDWADGIWDGNGNFLMKTTDADHEYDLDETIANNTWSAQENLNIPKCALAVDMTLQGDLHDDYLAVGPSNAIGGTLSNEIILSDFAVLHLIGTAGTTQIQTVRGNVPIHDLTTPGFKYILDDNATSNPTKLNARVHGWHDAFAPKL